jgi:hypothetical protein
VDDFSSKGCWFASKWMIFQVRAAGLLLYGDIMMNIENYVISIWNNYNKIFIDSALT